MTKEDDFQRMIDRGPDDWQTRLVLADWLEDRGDPRAAGYRAIAIQQRRPLQGQKYGPDKKNHDTWWWHCHPSEDQVYAFHNHIHRDWFDLLSPSVGSSHYWPVHTATGGIMSRRGCEDALALAFGKLPPERQAELLVPPPELNPPKGKKAGKNEKKPAKKSKPAAKKPAQGSKSQKKPPNRKKT